MNTFKTPLGDVEVTVIGHGSMLLKWNEKNIYVDPYSEVADYSIFPKADLVVVTHNHYDHYDPKANVLVDKEETTYVVSSDVPSEDMRFKVLGNNESCEWEGVKIFAVPAYNIERRNEDGNHFHPKGVGNGYVLDFGGYRFYFAGDTEGIDEMRGLEDVKVAFLPKNLPYTMSDDEFIDAAHKFMPENLYPIHFFELDLQALREKLDSKINLIDPLA